MVTICREGAAPVERYVAAKQLQDTLSLFRYAEFGDGERKLDTLWVNYVDDVTIVGT